MQSKYQNGLAIAYGDVQVVRNRVEKTSNDYKKVGHIYSLADYRKQRGKAKGASTSPMGQDGSALEALATVLLAISL